ncbi:uncharacterized protein PGTG_13134 [Puccinia graminis f. sp. tritici CRL 75-36-700-3]|uniref:Uncharacterized protein n=1 Tax=Puccinia graminis f. sp. tritici (strain CRL 75-36-700-3 / race SCCL) TaxID=418459 RepID=E3KR27_PUCGT|nr:uncharacterized protein PGTG_13134 [Puccinia graminis f. sp. tritici CRL 75-36-700-3]EFP86752.1 hypothetical protein PGTG_13134 [Puccinia graminis f. sp. tritici CRL 75-36-700-3]
MVKGYPLRIPASANRYPPVPTDTRQCQRIPASANVYPPVPTDTRQRVRMAPFPQKVGGYPGIPKDTRGRKARWPTGRRPFQPARYLYLVDRKGSLQGTSTSTAGRVSFQLARYKYLDGWKGLLPAGEVLVPRRPEGLPSSRQGIETSHNSGRELAPDKAAATIPISNHENGGAKEGSEVDKQIIETESIQNRMEHQHIGSGLEKTKIAASEHDLSTHHEKVSALENLAQKQADYDSMTKLLDWTNREIRIVFATQILENAPELHVDKSGIEMLKEIDEELTVVANAALSIYGPPKTPPEKSLLLKSSTQLLHPSLMNTVKVYKEGIPRLFELLYTPATLSPYYSYVGIASKSCILKMFEYLSKYKMMPTDLEDGFRMTMKSPAGLEWIAKEMQGAFLPGSKYGINFHVPLNEAVPRRPEGLPSSQRGTSTLPAGRRPFQPAL